MRALEQYMELCQCDRGLLYVQCGASRSAQKRGKPCAGAAPAVRFIALAKRKALHPPPTGQTGQGTYRAHRRPRWSPTSARSPPVYWWRPRLAPRGETLPRLSPRDACFSQSIHDTPVTARTCLPSCRGPRCPGKPCPVVSATLHRVDPDVQCVCVVVGYALSAGDVADTLRLSSYAPSLVSVAVLVVSLLLPCVCLLGLAGVYM